MPDSNKPITLEDAQRAAMVKANELLYIPRWQWEDYQRLLREKHTKQFPPAVEWHGPEVCRNCPSRNAFSCSCALPHMTRINDGGVSWTFIQ